MARVSADYVDTVGTAALYRKAVDGLLFELRDPHSVYLPPDRFAALSERTSGSYGGPRDRDQRARVRHRDHHAAASTPAERAGSRRAIGSWRSTVVRRAVSRSRRRPAAPRRGGECGHAHRRPGGVIGAPPVQLVREEIRMSPCRTPRSCGRGWATWTCPSSRISAAAELSAAIGDLQRKGMTTLVIDLRGNPGGLLDEGVARSPTSSSIRGRRSCAPAGGRRTRTAPGRPRPAAVARPARGGARGRRRRERVRDRRRRAAGPRPRRDPRRHLVRQGERADASPDAGGGAPEAHDRALVHAVGAEHQQPATPPTTTRPTRARTRRRPQDSAERRPTFRTARRRVPCTAVAGSVPTSWPVTRAAPKAELALQQALGRDVPRFRDLVTDYAVSLRPRRARRASRSRRRPAMRDELYRARRPRSCASAARSTTARRRWWTAPSRTRSRGSRSGRRRSSRAGRRTTR
jgi:carboxyl-terminal processing protease